MAAAMYDKLMDDLKGAMKAHDMGAVNAIRGVIAKAKDFDVYADGKKVYECRNNIHSLVKVPLDVTAKEIKIVFTATNGVEDVRIFACDIQ